MAVALLLFSMNSTAADNQIVTWTGAVSSDWSDPSNWAVGDTIDEADNVSGVYIDSLDRWIKEWDPSLGQLWFPGSVDTVLYAFNWDIVIGADAPNVCTSDWNTSNMFNSDLSAPEWTRAASLTVKPDAELIWGFKDWHTNYIYFDGKVTVQDTATIRAAKRYWIGHNANTTVILNDTCKMYCKELIYMGKVGETEVIEGEDTTRIPFSYVAKIIVNDKAFVEGGKFGFDLRVDNESALIVNGGVANGFIRDLANQTRQKQVIINAGEFQSLDDALSVQFAILGGVIASGNGAELIATEVDSNEDGTTDYISVTNSNPVVDETVSIKKVKELSVNIYPNPSVNGVFSINAPGTDRIDVTVYNSVGQMIYKQNYLSQDVVQVNAELSKGMYIVEIASGANRTAQKLIVR